MHGTVPAEHVPAMHCSTPLQKLPSSQSASTAHGGAVISPPNDPSAARLSAASPPQKRIPP
jgi:hypothetical protein